MTKVVTVEALSKQFRIGGAARSITAYVHELMHGRRKVQANRFWALDNVSFDVAEGEIFGIIGRNGSGKSTLLKILTGITRPTRGSATIRGRIGALLEVGTGFHPDLTGRENIYFNGTLLGMSRSDIETRFDEIVAFAEVEKFIDTQIKHYSSGMQARLGFAVASHLRPEILIVDEVLSVGDLMFQEKSVTRMSEMQKSGITTLFVSHNLNSVAALCGRSMLLDRGQVKAVGPTSDVLDQYLPPIVGGKARVDFAPDTTKPASFVSAVLEGEDGREAAQFDIDEDIWLRVRYVVRTPLLGLQLAVRLSLGRDVLFQTNNTDSHEVLGVHAAGIFEKRLRIQRMFLKEGSYAVSLLSGIPRELIADHENTLEFSVVANSVNTGRKGFRHDRPGKVILQGDWHDSNVGTKASAEASGYLAVQISQQTY
jgi:lipopolysaccharide transport system ATP-binding protein